MASALRLCLSRRGDDLFLVFLCADNCSWPDPDCASPVLITLIPDPENTDQRQTGSCTLAGFAILILPHSEPAGAAVFLHVAAMPVPAHPDCSLFPA